MSDNISGNDSSLTIDFDRLEDGASRVQLLQDNQEATSVELCFITSADIGIVSLDHCHLQQRGETDITRWVGDIAKELPHVTQVVLDTQSAITYQDWFPHCTFPVEALNQIFIYRQDTLVSLTVVGR